LDSSYKQVSKFGAANNLDGDLHEFRITPEGTALITIYDIIPADLTALGHKADGSIWDCVVQEIDLESGNALFQWRASEHHELTETLREIPNDDPFDWYHINSIDKDIHGNYLVSSRYLHAITYISGATGEIIWILGGKKNMFTDLSSGRATDFLFQHDARWQDDYTTITLFNNGAEDGHLVNPSRGMRIKIDQVAMTAELINEYMNPNHIFGVSQGSMQVLPNSNVLLGYGNSGAMTEYSANGTVICDVHWGPQDWFTSGDIQSYRTYKFDWIGRPDSQPDAELVVAEDGSSVTFYVSWNGDTEVKSWHLESTDGVEEGIWRKVGAVQRIGFETALAIKSTELPFVRASGVDSQGNVLATTNPWNWKQEKVCLMALSHAKKVKLLNFSRSGHRRV
jgi:hypothetical protein